jgi:hypothetical protein
MRPKSRVLRYLCVLVILTLLLSQALAQEAIVTRPVNLRRDPSTSTKPIRHLLPKDELELIDANQVDGYYHVRTIEGEEEGFVWGRNIRVIDAHGNLAPDTSPAGVHPLATTAVASAISESWTKPDLTVGNFTSGGKVCGPTGSDPGNETNRHKNRTDVPGSYHAVAFDALTGLPDLHVPKDRATWAEDDRNEIAKFEGVPVTVIGYLVAIKPQVGGSGESTNCKWTTYPVVDWHMALVKKPGQGEELAFVVETTPRVRRKHMKWTEPNLDPWLDSIDPVRISGWLMFDPEHRNHMGKFRQSMWEIHPITKIEVWKTDKWVDLDIF